MGVGIRSPFARLTADLVPFTRAWAAWISGRLCECLLDHNLLVDRWNVRRQGKLTERLDRSGLLGDTDLVPQVGQGREIVLPGLP